MRARVRMLATAAIALSGISMATLSASVPAQAGAAPVTALDTAGLQSAIDSGAVVIDVRRQDEWRSTGVVPGSALITAYDRDDQLSPGFVEAVRATASVDDRVVLICRSGKRSERAAQLLREQFGYHDVSNADGGIVAWTGSGRPLVPCPDC